MIMMPKNPLELLCAAVVSENYSMLPQKADIGHLSKEQITEALRKMLTSQKPVLIPFTQCLRLIKQIFPEIEPCIGFDQNNRYHRHEVYEHMLWVTDLCKTDRFEIKLAALLHDIGKPASYVTDGEGHGHFYGHPEVSYEICKKMLPERLALNDTELELVLSLIREHDRTVIPTRKSVRKFLTARNEAFIRDWFILKQADIDDHINLTPDLKWIQLDRVKEVFEQLLSEEERFKITDLDINGKDLMNELKMYSGKPLGDILRALYDEVIDGELVNEKTALLIRAKELSQNNSALQD